MSRVFAFGDVHGRPYALRALIKQARVKEGDTIVGLGDYFDRGPDTKAVLDYLCGMREDYDLRCIAGNHDGFWIAAYNLFHILPKDMIRLGGIGEFSDVREWLTSRSKLASMHSYGISPRKYNLRDKSWLPDDHADFLCCLRPYELIEIDGHKYLFVHAGLPSTALKFPCVKQAVDWTIANCPWEMTWGRTGFEIEPVFRDATIVHGHVPWKFVDEVVNGKPGNRVDKPISFNLPGLNFGKYNLDASVGLNGKEYLAGMWFPEKELVIVEGYN